MLVSIRPLAGSYGLVPYYKGENTVFDVSPPVMSVTVKHQHVTVPQKFQVIYAANFEIFILFYLKS